MALIDDLIEINRAQQLVELERIESKEFIKGDFVGSVKGNWKKLDDTGAGIVAYNGKQYTAVRIGFTALPPGTPVELSHANGVYFAKW